MKKAVISKCSADLIREIDPDAESLDELCKATGYSLASVNVMARQKTQQGLWEQVWKIGPSGRWVHAYRRKVC